MTLIGVLPNTGVSCCQLTIIENYPVFAHFCSQKMQVLYIFAILIFLCKVLDVINVARADPPLQAAASLTVTTGNSFSADMCQISSLHAA